MLLFNKRRFFRFIIFDNWVPNFPSFMKILVLVVSVFMLSFGAFAQQVKKVQIGEIEELVQKSDHPIIISFWATWCAPCLQEIPYFQEQ